jgi:hypothetical protein
MMMDNETREIMKIVIKIDFSKCDFFVSGECHKSYFRSHITVPEIMNYKKNNKYTAPYKFINDFYNDIGLDTSIYIEHFHIASTPASLEYYEIVKNYKIVFIHTKGTNRTVTVDLSPYTDKEYIVVCANGNVYTPTDERFAVAEKFSTAKVGEFIDIILNAEVIEILDSCFSCIVYPLFISGKISPKKCVIHEIWGIDGKIKTILS